MYIQTQNVVIVKKKNKQTKTLQNKQKFLRNFKLPLDSQNIKLQIL